MNTLLLLLSVECVVAALECAAQRLVVDMPERGVGLVRAAQQRADALQRTPIAIRRSGGHGNEL